MAVNPLQNGLVYSSICGGENLLRFIFPFSHSPFHVFWSWFKKLAHDITSSFSSPLPAIKSKSVPPCKLQKRLTYQLQFSRRTPVYKEFSQECKSCPRKYHKLLIIFVCNISGLSVLFLNFTGYHFLNSYPCPIPNGFAGRKLKTYTRCEKRPEFTQTGKLQIA